MIELKPLSEKDVTSSYVSWLNDIEIKKHLGGLRHRTEAMSSQEIISFVKDCDLHKRYHWGIFYEQKHIGNVSCSAWNHQDQWIDISYLIGEKDFHGKGIGTLCVGAAIEYLFATKKFRRIEAHAVALNLASMQVMKKLGFKEEACYRKRAYIPTDKIFVDEFVFGLLKDEFVFPENLKYKVKVYPMKWEEKSSE